VNLGRPWGDYAAAAYLNVAMGAHITTVGWTTMGTTTLANVRFSEYQSTGAGANAGGRVAQSTQLTAAQAANYTVANIFPSWTPSFGN
jgi:pectin methylesterase-like acyl-CoA thioesterase